MTDDYQLFDASPDGGPPIDPDVALIAAYLSNELTDVQVAAVEHRLTIDPAFATTMRDVRDAWSVPLAEWEERDVTRATLRVAPPSEQEREAGWLRFAGSERSATDPPDVLGGTRALPTRARSTLIRVAAVIAVTVVPMFALAQVVKYVATHPGAPGHAVVQALVPASWRAPTEIPRVTTLAADGELASLADAPVQQNILVPQERPPQTVPVVDLPAASARTTQTFGAILGIKHTSEGRVLVNDALRRQVLLFERDLATPTAVLDSVPGTSKSYGNSIPDPENAATWRLLSPFLGDSALFGPLPGGPNIRNFLVLDQRGTVVRAISINFSGLAGDGNPLNLTRGVTWDPMGRLVGLETPWGRGFMAAKSLNSTTRGTVYIRSDTLAVLRIDPAVRGHVDTLGFINIPENQHPRPAGTSSGDVGNGGGRMVPIPGADGSICWLDPGPDTGCRSLAKQVVNPLYVVDDWALLSDGTIAFVRGEDYHVDWVHANGTKTATDKLAFERRRLTDAEKQRIVDSTRAAVDSLDALAEKIEADLKPWRDSVTRAARAAGARMINQELKHPGPPTRLWPYEIVPLSQIADYYPPIRPGAAKPDADGNLWILPRTTSLSRQGELVYDVVNPTRGLAQRVRLPVGRSIAGFGKGGIVYLQHGDLKSGFILERTTLPAPIPR